MSFRERNWSPHVCWKSKRMYLRCARILKPISKWQEKELSDLYADFFRNRRDLTIYSGKVSVLVLCRCYCALAVTLVTPSAHGRMRNAYFIWSLSGLAQLNVWAFLTGLHFAAIVIVDVSGKLMVIAEVG